MGMKWYISGGIERMIHIRDGYNYAVTSSYMCILFRVQIQRTFCRHICGRFVNRGLYTHFVPSISYVVKLAQTLITLLDWRLSVGSIPAVAVTSRVTSLLTSSDVRIFRKFGSLPK
jgi:hypothetical protein